MNCDICENRCSIAEDGTGVCGMYTTRDGTIVERYPDSYLVVVPSEVESMPMLHYHPGSKFLQVCTIGCNFRCNGCVSWVLTEAAASMESALLRMTPEEVVERALAERCAGIMFCFNEPAVSFFTFRKMASRARDRGLLVGCATNGYFTEPAFRELLGHIDFLNIGVKGCTDETYSSFGVASASPVFRNLRIAHESGAAVEVAAVYVRGRESEVRETAKLVASVSKHIPFQVMRFIPFAGADRTDEPSIRDAEKVCEEVGKQLDYVYLFNSPGTEYLDTRCPECGKTVVRRGFNGPMCAHVADYREDGVCECGFRLPFAGKFEKESGAQVLGYFGGYKTIQSLESVQTVLAFLGERNPAVIASVLQEILKTDFIEGLYERTKEIDSYLDTVDYYARLAGRIDESRRLREHAEKYVSLIGNGVRGAPRPSVYFSLGHPLIAVFGDKFECNLVELAGGRCVNKDLERDETPGMTISPQALERLDPDMILITGAIDYSADHFRDFCIDHGLDGIKAVRDGKIYSMRPYNTGGRPDWVLGLTQMANLIHPEIFAFDVARLAREFYETFLGMRLEPENHPRSLSHPAILGSPNGTEDMSAHW
jgi:pyruvate-formate lyase-activating enzyme